MTIIDQKTILKIILILRGYLAIDDEHLKCQR